MLFVPDFRCQVPPRGWWCSRGDGHDGPCAARPKWWAHPIQWVRYR